MNKSAMLFCLVFYVSIHAATGAENAVVVHNGFIEGSHYRSMTNTAQRAYASGLIDGILLSPLFGADKARIKWLETLSVGMTDHQIAAILLLYLEKHPESWNESMHTVAFRALREAYQNKYEQEK